MENVIHYPIVIKEIILKLLRISNLYRFLDNRHSIYNYFALNPSSLSLFSQHFFPFSAEKTTPPRDHSKTRPVTINIIPSPSGYPTFDSSSVDLQPPSTEQIRPSVGRLTLSLGVMAPDEDQSHRPVRTLSLRLRPDDSWIVKRQASEEGDDISRRAPDSQERRRPISETTPATITSMTPPEPLLEEENEEEVEESRRRMNVVRTLPQFQNPLPTVMAASQQ